MMPERLAKTDAFKPLTEMVGSGPFKWNAEERVVGSLAVYERNAAYQPRAGRHAAMDLRPEDCEFRPGRVACHPG